MSDTAHLKCPRCGKELPVSAPEGLCPACLGALNFATETEVTGMDAKEVMPPMTPAELAPHFPQLEILECLGRGGMGVVYKARQKSLNRLVALKLLAPERVQDVKFAERFAREAQALAALNHPNIVTVHDFGQAGGFYFLLMEFVDGVNLRQLLRARKLESAEALAIVPPVCEALQYAHEHGIVHRDIKPENLLLAKDGRVKIADFGIAKMLGNGGASASGAVSCSADEVQGAGASATQQTTMGTPQYMAPEQREHPQAADHRADIYSLGVVLYELLTGELPTDKLQPPSRKVQIDVRLDEIVLRALEKTPELRYQTAEEFKTQVETIATKKSESDTPGEEDVLLNTARSGPLPRSLKAVICWMLVQGGLALIINIYQFALWGQVHVDLTVLDLAIGFGLMTLRTGWWRFAAVMNGVQILALILGVPLVLAAGKMMGHFVDPAQAFRSQPALLELWVLIEMVVLATCVLVHFTLMRLRSEGWFGPGAGLQKQTEYSVMVIVFYLGVLLGTLIINAIPAYFSRDAACMWVVVFMAALAPLAGIKLGAALRRAKQDKDSGRQEQIYGWLKVLSILAWVLALPIGCFGMFFFFALHSGHGGWHPSSGEAVLLPLTLLGMVLLPWAGLRLKHISGQAGVGSKTAKRAGAKWGFAGLLIFGLLIAFLIVIGVVRMDKSRRAVLASQREALHAKQQSEESLRWATGTRQQDAPPYIARLPYGGSVELLAVRLHPGNTNQAWWQPDGSSSQYGTNITMEGGGTAGSGVLGLVKINWSQSQKAKEGNIESLYGVKDALKDGVRVSMGNYSIIHFDRIVTNGNEATLYEPVGARDWETMMTLKPDAAQNQWKFSQTPSGNLKLSAKGLDLQQGYEYQLAAIDRLGNLHTPSSSLSDSTTGRPGVVYEAFFEGSSGSKYGLKPDQVKEVYWQQRRLDSIEFANVSLKPGYRTKVMVRDFTADKAGVSNGASKPDAGSATTITNQPLTPTHSEPEAAKIHVSTLLMIAAGVVILGLFIGGVVLLVWATRKNGAKGCLLVGGIMLLLLFLLVVGMVAFSFWSYQASRSPASSAQAKQLQLTPYFTTASLPGASGMPMQVQNGFRVVVPENRMVTFEVLMRQADDSLQSLPSLTTVVLTGAGRSFAGTVFWTGKRWEERKGNDQAWLWTVNGHEQNSQPFISRTDYETNITYHVDSAEPLNWWQMTMPTVTDMKVGASRDIPMFRTYGVATLDGKQPKEAILRVKCDTLPAGYKLGPGQYQLLLGNDVDAVRDIPKNDAPDSGTSSAAMPGVFTATASFVQDYDQNFRWRWRVTKKQPARILMGIVDSDANGLFGSMVSMSLRENPELHGDWTEKRDIMVELVKSGQLGRLKLEEQGVESTRPIPHAVILNTLLESWRQIATQTKPVELSSAYYQTLWETEVVRFSTDKRLRSPRKVRMVARLMNPYESEGVDLLGANDPVRDIKSIDQSSKYTPPTSSNLEAKSISLQSVTNYSSAISIMSSTALQPGEVIEPRLRFEDGRIEPGGVMYFVSNRGDVTERDSFSMNWQMFPPLAPEVNQTAVEQIQNRWANNDIVLTPKAVTQVFVVTNAQGGRVYGEIAFKRIDLLSDKREAKAHLAFKNATAFPGFVSANFFSGTLPMGYKVVGRGQFPADIAGEAHMHLSRSKTRIIGGVTWFLRPALKDSNGFTNRNGESERIKALADGAARQMNELFAKGPVELWVGHPVEAFSVTNSTGQVFSGSFELIGK